VCPKAGDYSELNLPRGFKSRINKKKNEKQARSVHAQLHVCLKKDTTQLPTIISTTVVRSAIPVIFGTNSTELITPSKGGLI